MMTSFPKFSQLPAKIRSCIWAMAATGWSYTTFKYEEELITSVGKIKHSNVAQACYESRQIAHSQQTLVEGLGWFDFDQHVFFFRHFKEDHIVMDLIFQYSDFFAHVKHIVINPEHDRLVTTVGFIRDNCPSLQTLVMIAPWFVLPPRDQWFREWSRWEETPYPLDDSQAFMRSPTELDLSSLLHGLDPLGAENTASIERYRSDLRQLVEQAQEDGEGFFQATFAGTFC